MAPRKANRRALLAALLCAVLSVAVLSLPIYQFEANVYTKRSGNTFRGDERSQAARQEVDALAEDYRARGIETEVSEEVIERVNSKGEKTSLIVFRVNKSVRCSGWDFLAAGFPSGSC